MDFQELAAKVDQNYSNDRQGIDRQRSQNLREIFASFASSGITAWLQGKTLLNMINTRWFARDHDDDIGIDFSDLKKTCETVIPALVDNGFSVIRVDPNDAMVSVIKRNRYVDICLLKENSKHFYGYSNKFAPKVYYDRFTKITAKDGNYFTVPHGAEEICSLKYPKLTNYMISSFVIWDHGLQYIEEIKELVRNSNFNHSILSINEYVIEKEYVFDLAFQLYCKERITKHIWDKSMHLCRLASRTKAKTYRIAIVKLISKAQDYPIHQNSNLCHILHRSLFEFKWSVRNNFNPLSVDPKLKLPYTEAGITHEHIIHGCDTMAELVQVDLLLQKYGKLVQSSKSKPN